MATFRRLVLLLLGVRCPWRVLAATVFREHGDRRVTEGLTKPKELRGADHVIETNWRDLPDGLESEGQARRRLAEDNNIMPTRAANWLLDDQDEIVHASDFAYAVALLNDNDMGIRTLGESLRGSATPADLLALLGQAVSTTTEQRLRAQGWIVRRLEAEETGREDNQSELIVINGAAGHVTEVLAHIAAWSLTQYKRVILLEDNMLVIENIDDLFQCPGTCAVMQQAELISTSLVVLGPSEEMFEDMLQSADTTYSYSGTFQGFLNSYMSGFESCTLFDLDHPYLQDAATDPKHGPDAEMLDHTCNRLPTRYNGELSLIMLNGGLGMVRTKNAMPQWWWQQRRARVIRFDFAGLRPWMWFAAPFLPFLSMWEQVHRRAQPYAPPPSRVRLLLAWLAFVVAGVAMFRMVLRPTLDGFVSSWSRGAKTASSSHGSVQKHPLFLFRTMTWTKGKNGGPSNGYTNNGGTYNPRGLLWSALHVFFGYSALGVSIVVGVWQVPASTHVWLSWLVFITWTCTVFTMLWALYLRAVSLQARLSPRSGATGTSTLGLAQVTTASALAPAEPMSGIVGFPVIKKGSGDLSKAKGEAAGSPQAESVKSLVLLAAAMAFLPSWKGLSGAASLGTLLGPVGIVCLLTVAGLTVQLVRLPVLWYDWTKDLPARAGDGLYN